MPFARFSGALPALWLGLGAVAASAAGLPKVPEGFEVRLVASVPAVESPCQVATAPDGSLFVAEDPMDQGGPADAPIDRILLFRDGKDPAVFAEGLFAVFGMVWHDGTLYVMNMPNLTAFRDTDGDGKADERRELFRDLGVPAGSPNGLNDHIVSGLQVGIDNFLYVSVGDKGVPKATGPDGRSVQLVGGGILRCRLDGTGLEVYSSGTRNHLEPNLDARDNLFTYDNTDDGQGWWTRVTHHVDGGYYGYPYDYHAHTHRMLPRMAEYGGGSPCGGLVYREDAWPERYRGRAFWAEWAKRQVRAFAFAPRGSTFEVADVLEFVEPDGVGDFRPLDLALSHDGRTLYVADWGLGGWGNKTEKLGRVYAVTYKGEVATRPRGDDSQPIEAQIRQLDHPSFNERRRAQLALQRKGREALAAVTSALAASKTDPVAARHLVWVLDAIAGGTPEGSLPLIEALRSPWPDVRAQAARALGVRAVPIAEEPLISLLDDPEPTVKLQAVIALGRIGARGAVQGLLTLLASSDTHLAFSARQALRRIGDWPALAAGLDAPDAKVRLGTMFALELVYEPEAASALARFAADPARVPAERSRALALLAEGHRKTPPWDGRWWGTQPTRAPAPAKSVEWEGTPLVLGAIRKGLGDPAAEVRAAAVRSTVAAGDRPSLPVLRASFAGEADPSVRLAIVSAFGALRDAEALPLLTGAALDAGNSDALRDEAMASISAMEERAAVPALIELVAREELGPGRRARAIAALGSFRTSAAAAPLIAAAKDREPTLRAAAAEALGLLGRRKVGGVVEALRPLLDDPSDDVRRRAIAALGASDDRASIPALIRATEGGATRYEATLALAAMPDLRALQAYLYGLGAAGPELRKASAAALSNLGDAAVPVLEELSRRNELSPTLLPELRRIYSASRPVTGWRVLGPYPFDAPPPFDPAAPIDAEAKHVGSGGQPVAWKPARAADARGQVDLGAIFPTDAELSAFAAAEVTSPAARTAPMVVGSDDTLTIWLNGKQVYDFPDRRSFAHDQARFDVSLVEGSNRLVVKCGNRGGGWQFAVAIASAGEYAFLKGPASGGFDPEAFRIAALKGGGDPAKGKALFSDAKGLACIKCHALDGQGGAVGPELSSIGAKYPREELITAVLFPSAKISQGYEPVIVAAADGRIITGIVKGEGPDAIELEDAEGRRVVIPQADVEERKRGEVSIMPSGLAEGLTPGDFADLIAFLESLKAAGPAAGEAREQTPPSPQPPAGR